jgi:hypothetical protein
MQFRLRSTSDSRNLLWQRNVIDPNSRTDTDDVLRSACGGRSSRAAAQADSSANNSGVGFTTRNDDMRLNALYMIAAAGLALTGCHKAESPAEVQHDVATAQAEGHADVAEAKADATENVADASKDVAQASADESKDVANETKDVNKAVVKGDYKITVAQAEATHKVATEKCEALSGAAQKDCKDRADNELDHAKKQAEQARDGAG